MSGRLSKETSLPKLRRRPKQGQHVGFRSGLDGHSRGLPDLEVGSTRQSPHLTMPLDITKRREEREAMSRWSPARFEPMCRKTGQGASHPTRGQEAT